MDAVQISRVTKTFGAVTAVDDLSLLVPEGSVCGFIGPNGSGKTTTLRIFYPDRGAIHVFGRQMFGARSESIGYLPEERGLYRRMAVRPLLEFYGNATSAQIENHRPDGIGAHRIAREMFDKKTGRRRVRRASSKVLPSRSRW
jgi:ABC-type uncharacterized transport system ATPase subunit